MSSSLVITSNWYDFIRFNLNIPFHVKYTPLHKICVWTQIRKIKHKLIFNQSESRIKDLRLIFLICVQTQILCNGANITRKSVAFHFGQILVHLATLYFSSMFLILNQNLITDNRDCLVNCLISSQTYNFCNENWRPIGGQNYIVW